MSLGVRLGANTVLENINLHMHCGEFTVVIGPNGAGKTTLLRALTGEISHTGQIVFVPSTAPAGSRPPRFGYLPQRMEIDKTSPLTVMDLFACARTSRPVWLGHARARRIEAAQALARVQAGELLDHRIGQLSCGQMQRVLLALALTPMPEILLLDEPLAGLDHAGTLLFYEIVSSLRREIDLSVLLVSHDLAAAATVADRIILLNHTVLFDGTPAEALQHAAVRSTFGLDLAPLAASARNAQCPLTGERS
jgi:zinc transport system ATP-binding protein